jgi:hypothetical membrane protein
MAKQKNRCCRKLKQIGSYMLKTISLGAYRHGIYFEDNNTFSTAFGGFLTFLGFIIVLIYAINVLK